MSGLAVFGIIVVCAIVLAALVGRATLRLPIVEMVVAPSGAAELMVAPVPASADPPGWRARGLIIVTRAFGTVRTAVCSASPGPGGGALISSAAGAFPPGAGAALGPDDHVLISPFAA